MSEKTVKAEGEGASVGALGCGFSAMVFIASLLLLAAMLLLAIGGGG